MGYHFGHPFNSNSNASNSESANPSFLPSLPSSPRDYAQAGPSSGVPPEPRSNTVHNHGPLHLLHPWVSLSSFLYRLISLACAYIKYHFDQCITSYSLAAGYIPGPQNTYMQYPGTERWWGSTTARKPPPPASYTFTHTWSVSKFLPFTKLLPQPMYSTEGISQDRQFKGTSQDGP